MSSRLSYNSEAFASELLEDFEDMFLRYYMHSQIVELFACDNHCHGAKMR